MCLYSALKFPLGIKCTNTVVRVRKQGNKWENSCKIATWLQYHCLGAVRVLRSLRHRSCHEFRHRRGKREFFLHRFHFVSGHCGSAGVAFMESTAVCGEDGDIVGHVVNDPDTTGVDGEVGGGHRSGD